MARRTTTTTTPAAEPLVTLREVESAAGFSVQAAGISLNGQVQSDWQGRPAVPASLAAELYPRLAAARDLRFAEHQRWQRAQIAAERYSRLNAHAMYDGDGRPANDRARQLQAQVAKRRGRAARGETFPD